jgi:hypothetical protein
MYLVPAVSGTDVALRVDRDPVDAIGADHADAVAEAIVGIGRLAGGALEAVALVEHEALRTALGHAAPAVLAWIRP